MQNFIEEFQTYTAVSEVRTNCNSITVVNTGTAIAVLEGLEIGPGDQYISLGNEQEFNSTRYRLSFTGGGTEQVVVIRKIYK
jgi:hypothetical protein